MKKEFVPYEVIRDNAVKLAYRIYMSGFIPDVIYVCLRGGVYIGNILSEYFKIIKGHDAPLFYAAVVARSYFYTGGKNEVVVDGWTYDPSFLKKGEKILFADDIFDSGNTINHLIHIILGHGIKREDIKIAVHDYKVRTYLEDNPEIKPDFWCRYREINNPRDDTWIHYLSHEIDGLSKAECRCYFTMGDEELEKALEFVGDKL
ncbi:MAG: phosphoribosyltransferase [Spirochaetales bacterium]|nr:phosphoribosyltransferase [Spirochaetales bacterium]